MEKRGRSFHPQNHSTGGIDEVNLTRSIWQQTMRRQFVRRLVVFLAAFAVFAFVYPDDLWEDAAYTESEMLKGSSEGLPTHQDQQAVDSSLLAASSKSTYSPSSEARATSPTLVSLSTCVLLC